MANPPRHKPLTRNRDEMRWLNENSIAKATPASSHTPRIAFFVPHQLMLQVLRVTASSRPNGLCNSLMRHRFWLRHIVSNLALPEGLPHLIGLPLYGVACSRLCRSNA